MWDLIFIFFWHYNNEIEFKAVFFFFLTYLHSFFEGGKKNAPQLSPGMRAKWEILDARLYGNTLAAVQESTDAPNTFSEFLNTNHPSIKFTMEMKQTEHIAIPRLWTKMYWLRASLKGLWVCNFRVSGFIFSLCVSPLSLEKHNSHSDWQNSTAIWASFVKCYLFKTQAIHHL